VQLNQDISDNPVLRALGWLLKLYGRFIRFVLHRVFAVIFMVGGSLMSLMDGLWVLMGKPVGYNGQPNHSVAVKFFYVTMPLLIALMGWVLWRTNSWWVRSPGQDSRTKEPWE
jgi:hypothetical protein